MLNAAIGIAQEIAARKKVEQLSLLTAPRAKVSRDGVVVEILPKELHLGDRLVLESGMQICADAVLESGSDHRPGRVHQLLSPGRKKMSI